VHEKPEGPAFLIYYGPAFLQNLGNDSAVHRLSILAEVYRCARSLWPAFEEAVAKNVIVRIDVLKGLPTHEIMEAFTKGDMWLMIKHNDSEAFIERANRRKLNKYISSGQLFQILDHSNTKSYAQFSELN